jgi:hypothetical protein
MDKIVLACISFLTINMLFFKAPKKDMPGKDAAVQYDGPYVFYKNRQLIINYIEDDNETKAVKTNNVALKDKNTLSLTVMTDIPGKQFNVTLKNNLQSEKSEYPKANKLLVISDIEGNFGAFRKLLIAAKVIDENFSWTFGNGEVVLTGDFFDRGEYVTELLWFIYCLEDKAKAAGGYIHFVLGNHEIMNLSGDLRYVNQKYFEVAKLLEKQYVSLYDENSELGKWLRTKNVVEKIGDIIFTHGGISGYISRMNISVPEINTLARPYYSDSSYVYKDLRSDTIFSNFGPFWYRGYYEKTNSRVPELIDSVLSQYNVNHIITGHTIVADTISMWFDGKLFNTDVHHAAGKSEALLIEDDKYYRVNAEGEKVLMMAAKNPG